MKPFQSRSQAGQDQFCWDILGPGPGTFLDIGAGHPSEKSNTFELERHGWTGVLVETDAYCVGIIKEQRKARLLNCDATQVHWSSLMDCSRMVDYLSLDVDFDSLAVLKSLMASGPRYRMITCEHDAYRFGQERRDEMVQLLTSNGYDILCADVMDKGLPFELWAVDPLTVDMAKAEKFRRGEPTDWKEFWK